jgi:protein SDA1
MAPFSLSSSSGTAMAATSAPVIATAAAGTNGNIHTRRLDVTLKLSQLQNFCKRDPSGYRAEYDAQVRRLESELHVLALQGGKTSGGGGASSLMAAATTGALPPSKLTISAAATPSSLSDGTTLQELMQFVAAVSSSSYKGAESDRIASVFIRLLVGSDPGGDSGSDSNKGDDGGREDHEIDWSGAEAGMASSLSRTQKKKVKEKDKILDVSSVTYLASHNSALQLDRSVRHTAVSCLILMRNKGAIDPLRLLPIFFRLLAVVPDKALRELVYRHMVQDVTNLNKKASADSVNRSLQSFLHRIVETYGQASSGPAVASSATSSSQAAQRGGGDGMIDPQCATSVAARRATDMVADLYRRRVWTGPRAVAILASAAVSGNPGVAARAIRFFLNIEEKMADDQARDRERKAETKMRIDYHAHSKKTAARQRHVERQKKNRAKMLKKKEEEEGGGGDTYLDLAHDKGVAANKKLYPAIELLRDPQGLAEGEWNCCCCCVHVSHGSTEPIVG